MAALLAGRHLPGSPVLLALPADPATLLATLGLTTLGSTGVPAAVGGQIHNLKAVMDEEIMKKGESKKEPKERAEEKVKPVKEEIREVVKAKSINEARKVAKSDLNGAKVAIKETTVSKENQKEETVLEKNVKKLSEKKVVSRWSVGEEVVARWADDGVWYRARVEARDPAGTYTVTFLDYGNQAEVAEAAMVAHRGKVPKAEVEMIDEFVLEAKEQEVVREAASGKDGPNWEEVGRRVVRVVEVRGAAEHRAVEAAYLGEHGEAPPEGWAWRLQLQGRVRVEEGLYSLPLPPSEVVGSSGGGGKCEELGAWEEWEVRVCRVWREEATILLTIQRADLPAYPALQQAMARYYGQQGNRVEEEAVEGALVAVCRGGWWYRGRVVGRGEGRAVHLVDTGEEAPAAALQPLWRQFGQLPAAAVQAELGGVALVKGKRTAAVEWVQGQVAGARLAAQARWTEAGHLALTLGLGEVGDLATQMVTKGLAKATYSH